MSLFWEISRWVGAVVIVIAGGLGTVGALLVFIGWLGRPWSRGECDCGEFRMGRAPHLVAYLFCHRHALKCEKARGKNWKPTWWFAVRSGLARSWRDLWWWV